MSKVNPPPNICPDCKKACHGKRCKVCSRKYGFKGHSKENADAQRVTFQHNQGKPQQRGSWWASADRQDFTAYASAMVVSDDNVKTVFNWRIE